jgi:hypothetical protein
LNRKGQFSIIAALLVAVVLITTVVATYSTIRNSPVPQAPQIQSAVDEINLAAKQILGFTVGYYGSILTTTGNSTYATELATEYLQSGLVYAASMHPDWGASFNVTDSELHAYWYASTSYSSGNLSVSYNLTGLGISGISYQTSCSLTVQVMPTINNQAYLSVLQDGNNPIVNLGTQNFMFYQYNATGSLWNQVNPPDEPLAYSNGTYQIDIPSGIDVNSYLIQVEDQRGITVTASSFSYYTVNFAWNVTPSTPYESDYYVDSYNSAVDGSPDIGTHSNFAAMQHGPDGIMDTLTEGITTPAVPEKWVRPFQSQGSGWTNPSYAYDNNTSTRASTSIPANSWSPNLTLVANSNGLSSHRIRYFIGGSDATKVDQVIIYVYNGTWKNVYSGSGTWNQWTNVSFTEMSVSKIQFQFHNKGSSSASAYVYEAQFLQSGTLQNCQLNMEVQWTNVNYNQKNQWLCIYGGAMAPENIKVDVRNAATWTTLFTGLVAGWNNVSVSQYVTSLKFTIRFSGANQGGDSVQDSWQIDAALLRSVSAPASTPSGTTVVELLQNGTMRWLAQNLQQTLPAKPIPPVPVKSIHVNQTIANVDSEVPFQIEDWASDYRIPLGLSSNLSVFSSRTMLVFLADSNVSKVTIWWNGSDTAAQTPYAYTNRYFTGDDVSNGVLTNGVLTLKIDTGSSFQITSTQGTSTATATLMRINGQNSIYGSIPTFSIHHGVVRDVVTQEAEWSNGAPNCPNLYAYIVLTLPANATYYTYQLRLMFLNSSQTRTMTDLCPLSLNVATGSPQTENGTSAGYPIMSNAVGLFYNQPPYSAHHWSQFISGTKGAGIIFTDDANQKLYFFDSPGKPTGAISVSTSNGNVIELRPVSTLNSVSNFQNQSDVTWYGAVVTFDGTMPIYQNNAGVITGLWMIVEYTPVITVTTGS